MGAGQSFQWGTSFPSFADCLVPFCGAARTAEHNQTFLKSLISAVKLDPKWDSPTEVAVEGKKAFSAIYSAWGECAREFCRTSSKAQGAHHLFVPPPGLSQAFYREKLYRKMGFETLDEFLEGFWVPLFAKKDARNVSDLYITSTDLHEAETSLAPTAQLVHMLNTWHSADIVLSFFLVSSLQRPR
jgi:homoserine O-acetyltransferase/O-succinyltransferase